MSAGRAVWRSLRSTAWTAVFLRPVHWHRWPSPSREHRSPARCRSSRPLPQNRWGWIRPVRRWHPAEGSARSFRWTLFFNWRGLPRFSCEEQKRNTGNDSEYWFEMHQRLICPSASRGLYAYVKVLVVLPRFLLEQVDRCRIERLTGFGQIRQSIDGFDPDGRVRIILEGFHESGPSFRRRSGGMERSASTALMRAPSWVSFFRTSASARTRSGFGLVSPL